VPEVQNDVSGSLPEPPGSSRDDLAVVDLGNDAPIAVIKVAIPDVVRRMRAATVTATEEAPSGVFDEVATAWAAGQLPYQRRRRSRPVDGTMGIGITVELNDALAFAVVTGALGEVLAEVAITTWRHRRSVSGRFLRRRRRGRHRLRPDAVPPAGTVILHQVSVSELRVAFVNHAVALGLPADQAAVIADAAVNAVLAARVK
jgi:hypothetical protein